MIWAKRHTCEKYLLNYLIAYPFSIHICQQGGSKGESNERSCHC
jgi:hypothetical protein